jgi:hypothetical protein
MIQETVTLDSVIDLLNEALELDQEAMSNLVSNRAECNEALAEHPTIQCSSHHVEGTYTIGLLGIINGIFGVDEDLYGAVTMVLEDGKITKVVRTDQINYRQEQSG